MGYKKGPVGHMKASTGNKAVGYMAEGSAAYMSALKKEGDPKDGSLISRDNQMRLDAMGANASSKLAKAALENMNSDLYKDSTSTLPGLKPKKQSKSYGERQVEKAMNEVTYVGTDQKISRGDAQIRQIFDPVRTQYEKFEAEFGKGATPNKPFIAVDYGKGQTEDDVKMREQMNYEATKPITTKKYGLIKPTAQQIGGYQTRQTIEKVIPTLGKNEKASFVKGDSEIRVQRNPKWEGYSSYTRGAKTGELSDATKRRKRKTGSVFGGVESAEKLSKRGAGFVKKGTNPYLPLN